MKILVVVPVYNKVEYTKNFFYSFIKTLSIKEKEKVELLFINNNSSDGTKEFLEEISKEDNGFKVSILNNEENLGVVKSWNQGLNFLEADYYLICNNDIEFMTLNWITSLLNDVKPEIYWLSPRTCYTKDNKKVSYTRSHYEQLSYGSSRQSYVVGCCFLISKECINEIGQFDEQFEMRYYEDLDYINRIISVGKRVKMANGMLIFHAVGITSRGGTGGENNEARYLAKWANTPHDILNNPLNRRVKGIKIN